jgi:replicative DNA helicase
MEELKNRIPPQSLDAELAVLGAMMLSTEAVGQAIEQLKTENVFYNGKNRKIYNAILRLYEKNEPVDILTLSEELQRGKDFDQIGGQNYLNEVLNSVTSAANVKFHIDIVMEKYLYRQMIFHCENIIANCYDETDKAEVVMDAAENRIFNLAEHRRTSSFQPLSEVLAATIEKLEQIHQSNSDITGVSSGFADMDKLTAGFQNGDLIILAGRPSMGKTAFSLNLARNAALDHQIPVAFFSLEMAAMALAQRLLTVESLVDAQKLRTGKLPDNDWVKLGDGIGRLANAAIFIDDTPALSVMEMRSKARRLKSDHNVGLIIVDYLQLMESSTPSRSGDRQQEISQISRSLKALAKELNIPLIALSQLSRAVESRTDKRPMLSDLRESGAIEQDADVVFFVYRPEYYKIDKFPGTDLSTENMSELIIGKQRNGPTGSIRLTFAKEYGRFMDPMPDRDLGGDYMPPDLSDDGTDITF